MYRRVLTAIVVIAIAPLVVLATPVPAFADSVRDNQWYLDALGVNKAHELSKGEGVTIGLIDTGVDPNHPDLKGNVEAGNSFGGVSGDGLKDEYDHGTGIASILVGHGHGKDNSRGILGIAPKAEVISVNAGCDSKCHQAGNGIGDSIKWLADQDVDLISVSMVDTPPEANDAIDFAASKEIPIVAGAGNVKTKIDHLGIVDVKGTAWPAISKGVIPVSGTTRDNKFWNGSQDLVGAAVQPQLGLSAPATDIPAASPGGAYATHSGTSGSAPIVAGTLALIKSAYPELTYNQWIDRLLDTTDDKGSKGFDDKFGAGIVNPYRALTEETTYQGKDGGQVSSPNDRLPLEEQGKGSGNTGMNDDAQSDGSNGELQPANSNTLVRSLGIIGTAVVLAIAVVVVGIVITRRRRLNRNTPSGSLAEPQ